MKFFTTVALIGTASALNLQRREEGETFEAHAERYLRENGVTDQDFADAGVGSMEDAFELADGDDDGEVTLDEAAGCLAGLGFKDGDFDAIKADLEIEFHEWDADEDGGLDMEESGWGFEDHALWWMEETFGVTEQDFADEGFESIGDVFAYGDKDGDEEVTAEECARAFADFDLIDEDDIGEWAGIIGEEFGFHDEDESGGIDIRETGWGFEDHALWWMDKTFGVTEQDFADEGFESLEEVFAMGDADGDGEVTPVEAASALAAFELIGADEVEAWAGVIGEEFGAYDENESGGLDLDEVGGEIDLDDGGDFEDEALEWMFDEFGVTEQDFADEGFTCLGDVFAYGDKDGDGQVTPEEAAGALADFELIDAADVGDWAATIAAEFGDYDSDESGGLDWSEVAGDDTD